MNWKILTSLEELEEVVKVSHSQPVVVFKHSTRCSVSLMAKKSLEYDWNLDDVPAYYLDLIAHRDVSNEISQRFEVIHQSPQLIGIKNGDVFYHASHQSISVESFKSALV